MRPPARPVMPRRQFLEKTWATRSSQQTHDPLVRGNIPGLVFADVEIKFRSRSEPARAVGRRRMERPKLFVYMSRR